MATMPGLPMFAHGQVEGLREKYGMEFRRAYWNETANGGLVARHEREIFPLLRRRHVFSGVELIPPVRLLQRRRDGERGRLCLLQRSGEERGLVLYNNRYAEARGWVKTSAAFAARTGSGKALVQKCLGEGLALPNEEGAFAIFREHLSGLQFIRGCRELWDRGMYAELGAFKCQVFLDFSVVRDGAEGRWARLSAELAGRGVPRMDTALREMELRPVRDPFSALLEMGPTAGAREGADRQKAARQKAVRRFEDFLAAAERMAAGRIDRETASKDFLDRLAGQAALAGAFLWPWTILRPLCGPDVADSPLPSWLEEWMLAPILRDFLLRAAWPVNAAEAAPALIALALRAESLCAAPRGAASPAHRARKAAPRPAPFPWKALLADQAAERFLRVNTFEGTRWFAKESLELLLDLLPATLSLDGFPGPATEPVLKAAAASGYRWDDFLAAISTAPDRGAVPM